MSGKFLIILLIIGLGLGFLVYSRRNKTEDTLVPPVTTTTDGTAIMMEDGAGGPPTTYTDGTYTLDTNASSIAWTGSKTLIKNYEDHGTLSFSGGTVAVESGVVTSGTFTVDMNSFNVTTTGRGSGNDMLEGHLKSEDFFEVATYPTATIELVSVANGSVTADVTIKGITKQVTFPATISEDGTALVGNASLVIDRTNWDIQYGSTKFFGNLGDNVIDDKVTLVLTLRATR
ncbi:MAG: YceI family protein [Patescibacteria group bacterium]